MRHEVLSGNRFTSDPFRVKTRSIRVDISSPRWANATDQSQPYHTKYSDRRQHQGPAPPHRESCTRLQIEDNEIEIAFLLAEGRTSHERDRDDMGWIEDE